MESPNEIPFAKPEVSPGGGVDFELPPPSPAAPLVPSGGDVAEAVPEEIGKGKRLGFVGLESSKRSKELTKLIELLKDCERGSEACSILEKAFPGKVKYHAGGYKRCAAVGRYIIKYGHGDSKTSPPHLRKEADLWLMLDAAERKYFAEIVYIFKWGHIQRYLRPHKQFRHCGDLPHDREDCYEAPPFKKWKMHDLGDGVRNHVHRVAGGKPHPVAYDYGFNEQGAE